MYKVSQCTTVCHHCYYNFPFFNVIITNYAISIRNISYLYVKHLIPSLFDSLKKSSLVFYYCFCWMTWWLSFYNVAFFKL